MWWPVLGLLVSLLTSALLSRPLVTHLLGWVSRMCAPPAPLGPTAACDLTPPPHPAGLPLTPTPGARLPRTCTLRRSHTSRQAPTSAF